MTSASISNGILNKFTNNQRLAVGAAITYTHASVLAFLLTDNVSRWRFLAYTAIPSLITVITPFLATRTIINWFYEEESAISYLETLSKTSDESESVAAEVEMTEKVRNELPEEVSDADSVRIIERKLLDNVEGEEFDPVDADTRGVVAIGFASLLFVFSGPITGMIIDGISATLIGILCGLVGTWIVLQQHKDMIGLMEHTPNSINS